MLLYKIRPRIRTSRYVALKLEIKLKSGIDDVTTKLNGMLEDRMNSVN